MKVVVIKDDGTEADVTEPVKVAYDVVRQSLDWGSDFLDYEELAAILLLARACDFPDLASAEEEVRYRVNTDIRRGSYNAARARAAFTDLPAVRPAAKCEHGVALAEWCGDCMGYAGLSDAP